MECLCAIVYQLGKKYLIFIPMVNRVLLKHKIQHDKYEALVKKIYKVLRVIFQTARLDETCGDRYIHNLSKTISVATKFQD